MDYLIFARKFRPQTFEEIVGQGTITTTLKNAIRQERVPQSFLFSGPRGVGKTSTARILAKALNCKEGPTEKPCGKCVSCKEIEQGSSMDVLEIDGASNRGIEEIRTLRENVKFKPSAGRYKIYIIDEVHSLTGDAFNALLKTLEEPPAHVKFIFATTESHKVPLTILSRCQRLQFQRISVPEAVEKLEKIAQKEKLKYEKNALFLIAKNTEGALRDAESLLDQLASFSEGKIKEEDVLTLLGLASEETYLSVLGAIRARKGEEVFEFVKKIYAEGADLAQFAKGLFETFRNLLMLQTAPGAKSLIEANPETISNLQKLAAGFSQGELLLGLSILQNLQAQLRRPVASPKLLLEAALLKLVYMENLRQIDEVIREGEAGKKSSEAVSVVEKKTQKPDIIAPENKTNPKPRKIPEASDAGMSSAASLQPAPSGDLTLNEVEKAWPQVIERVKAKRMSTSLFLAEAEPAEVEGSVIILGLPSEFRFHKETLEKDSNKQIIEEAFTQALGKKVRVQCVVTEREGAVQGAPEEIPPVKNEEMPDIVSKALEIFDGSKVIRKD
ncbi:MAG TPA: DNA polymerase III subunit gamma/tau [Candidatus Omnitrophota bacterium]|nr:DNA polymerase III subunit gamma/tau [Candidatus Omnitrophota bacterium]HRY84999.1 DNA polymerase III subunit gamma/tau [Candidatus Omnitrophota bacterium]